MSILVFGVLQDLRFPQWWRF